MKVGVMKSDEDKLKAILNEWIKSHYSEVSWDNLDLIQALKEVRLIDTAISTASIFGDILLNADRETRSGHNKRSLAHMNKKKATFIYQFLVNDLTVEYK